MLTGPLCTQDSDQHLFITITELTLDMIGILKEDPEPVNAMIYYQSQIAEATQVC